MRSAIKALCGMSMLLFAGTTPAHTRVAAVVPADGAELDATPVSIEIEFEHEVRLTSVVLLDHGNPLRHLEFSPHGSAERFHLDDPELPRGRSEIQWKALSTDGHVISGTLTYFVRTAPADTD